MLNSLKKNKKGICLMLFSSLLVCLGQLLWKLSANGNLFYLLLGFISYGFGALVMLYAYKFGSLSVLQPMLSANYIFTIIFASTILHEQFTFFKLMGIIIVFLGVFLIGCGDE